jgi:hypothetical protein
MSPPGPRPVKPLLVAGLVLGAALRLLALPWPGTSDVPLFGSWAYAAATQGVVGCYGAEVEWQGRSWKKINYPPLAMATFAAVGHAYHAIDPSFSDGPLLRALIKTPAFLADAALAALLFAVLRRRQGERPAALATLGYWLNPAVVLNGSVLGYQDPLLALPSVAAVLAAAAGRPALAGSLGAVAVLLKPQAVLIAPVLLVAMGSWRALARSAAAAALTAAVVVTPFVAAGAAGRMVRAVAQLGTHDMYSGDAANVWWLVTWVKRAASQTDQAGIAAWTAPVRILRISMAEAQGLPNPRPFGTALVLLAAGWATWRARRGAELGLLAGLGGFLVHAYFTLAVGVHENHLFLAVPLSGLAAALRPAFRGPWLAVSAVTALNLNFIYGLGQGMGGALPRGITLVDATVLLAAANVAALAWHAVVLARETAQRPSST